MSRQGDPPPPGRPGRAARWSCVLLACAAAAGVAAAETIALPLNLEDPVAGQAVRVDGGARALHLVFFATWCPPCLDELPRLAELEARWGDRGYRLVLIAVENRQTRERLAQFARNQSPPGQLAFDATGEVQRRCGVSHLPAHLVLDRSGTVVARGSALGEKVESAVAELLRRGR